MFVKLRTAHILLQTVCTYHKHLYFFALDGFYMIYLQFVRISFSKALYIYTILKTDIVMFEKPSSGRITVFGVTVVHPWSSHVKLIEFVFKYYAIFTKTKFNLIIPLKPTYILYLYLLNLKI